MKKQIKPGFFGITAPADAKRVEFDIMNDQCLCSGKKADVVLMMLYAGRPFDATDRDIIFKNVSQCGIGKVLIGINKYDIPYCSDVNPEDEEQIKDYFDYHNCEGEINILQ